MGGPGSGRRKAVDLTPALDVEFITDSKVKLVKVRQPTGADIEVQGQEEAKFYNAQKKKYLDENKFSAVTDLADLDKVLFFELLDYRWTLWLGRGKDYDGAWLTPGAEEQYRRNKNEGAKIVLALKEKLGLTKESRDATTGSVPEYIATLKRRAKEFGVMRNEQIVQAIVLAKELKSIVLSFDRMNDVERRVVGIESEADIVQWVRETFIPQFEAVDDRFREQQKLWVGTL